jgi:MFS family permease
LLVYPIIFIIVDFIALTAFLTFKDQVQSFKYLSILAIMIFIMCFALGLGPIPFLYTAECFPQSARSSAMSLAVLVNWLSGLLLTIAFPFLHNFIQQYVFLVFTFIMAFVLVVVLKKMPESKGKSVEEILELFKK